MFKAPFAAYGFAPVVPEVKLVDGGGGIEIGGGRDTGGAINDENCGFALDVDTFGLDVVKPGNCDGGLVGMGACIGKVGSDTF